MESNTERPRAIILAGPNGAGKTTAAPILLRGALGVPTFVNADTIALGLSGFAPEAADREAGEVMLRRLDRLQEERATFAFETTLAGRGHASRIRSLTEDGYHVHLLYIWLPHPDLAVARVKIRVRLGGHDIPEPTIRRRYARSMSNLVNLFMPIVSSWRVYDGRGRPPPVSMPLIARGKWSEAIEVRERDVWARIQRQLFGASREEEHE